MFSTRQIFPNIYKNLRSANPNCHKTALNNVRTTPKCSISSLAVPRSGNIQLFCHEPPQYSTILIRSYAKGKDKKKDKGKGKVTIDENQIAELVNIEALKTQMAKAVTHMEEEFVKHLSLRSTTGAIESIPVHLDGQDYTLQELAQIVRKNPKTIVINFSTFPQAIPAALKSLDKSGMNLNPQQDGTTLFIPIPKVTKEHREQLSKNAKQLFVKCKDSVREVQIKFVKQVKKKDKISEDLVRNVEQQIVAIADHFITEADSILMRKQTELLGDK